MEVKCWSTREIAERESCMTRAERQNDQIFFLLHEPDAVGYYFVDFSSHLSLFESFIHFIICVVDLHLECSDFLNCARTFTFNTAITLASLQIQTAKYNSTDEPHLN